MKARIWSLTIGWLICTTAFGQGGATDDTRTLMLWQAGDQLVLCAANAITTNAANGKFEATQSAGPQQVPMRQRRCLHLQDATTSETVEIRSHHFIGVQPGTSYEITAHVRSRNVSGVHARVLLRYADVRRDLTRELEFLLPEGGATGQDFRREIVTPRDCGSLFLAVQTSPHGQGEWWLENVKLRQLSQAGSKLVTARLLRWKSNVGTAKDRIVSASVSNDSDAVQADVEINDAGPKKNGPVLRLEWCGAQITTDTCCIEWEEHQGEPGRGMIAWKRRSSDLASTISLLRYPLTLPMSARAINPPELPVPRGATQIRLVRLPADVSLESFELITRREAAEADAYHE